MHIDSERRLRKVGSININKNMVSVWRIVMLVF
jgi:hypothetical protein